MSPEKEQLEVVRIHYPRIATAIELMWGTPECQTYLNGLIFDTRGDRQGFPLVVASALMQLHSQHRVPNHKIDMDEIWLRR